MLRSSKKANSSKEVNQFYLDEIKFWFQILEEHTVFLKAGLPAGENSLRKDIEKFNQELCELKERACKVKNGRQFLELICEAICIVKEFYLFQRRLVLLMLCCKLKGCSYPLLVDHLAREAEYVLHLLEGIRDCNLPFEENATTETVFWLRIMADHAKFICHLLDPSERNLIQTAQKFTDEFDNLFLQGKDFESMLYNRKAVPSFCRFLQDVKVSTGLFRDFKKAARKLIKDCRLVGIIPELLADHIYREAEHFLMILSMMERMIGCCNAPLPQENAENTVCCEECNPCDPCNPCNPCNPCDVEEITLVSDVAIEANQNNPVECEEIKMPVAQDQNIDEEIDDDAPLNNPIANPTVGKKNDAKYKWSKTWPRPLGKKIE